MTGDETGFAGATSDKGVAAALVAGERREQAINRDGFKGHGLREGEIRQGLDGRVWRVLGPATLPGSDALVCVEDVATGAVEHRYARTVALWTELHLASPAERHRTQADGPSPSRGGGPPPLPGPPSTPFTAKRPAMPGGPHDHNGGNPS